MQSENDFFPVKPKKWVAEPYMKRAVKFLLEHSSAALFLDPGSCKTSITLEAFRQLRAKGLAKRALVVAPLRPCYLVWPAEIKKWIQFSGLKVEVLHGPGKEMALKRDADIYVINPEGLEWLTGATKVSSFGGKKAVRVDPRRFKAMGFDTLILDELTKFKNISSMRFKMLKPLLPTFKRRWGLTGSPTANGLLDLFGQCYILDMGECLGKFLSHFRNEHFIQIGDSGWNWKLMRGAEDKIYERMAPLAFRFSIEEHASLPELIDVPIFVDLPPAARKIYQQLEDDLFTMIDREAITAANAGVASGKCRQICSGAIYAEQAPVEFAKKRGKREYIVCHDAKLDALEEIIEELQGAPLLVGYDFNHDQARICERIGDVPFIGKGTTPKRSKEIETAWNNNEIPILLGHPQSMGHGLNFQEGDAAHVAWFSATWDYELYDQFIRRIRRRGNKTQRIRNYLLMAKDTVDEVVFWTIRAKAMKQQGFFEALKNLSARRK